MGGHNNIDELFSKGLGQYSEMPSGAVWEGVARKTGARLLWKRLFYYGSGLILVCVVTACLFYFFNESPSPLSESAQKSSVTEYESALSTGHTAEVPIKSASGGDAATKEQAPPASVKTESVQQYPKAVSDNKPVHQQQSPVSSTETAYNTPKTQGYKETENTESTDAQTVSEPVLKATEEVTQNTIKEQSTSDGKGSFSVSEGETEANDPASGYAVPEDIINEKSDTSSVVVSPHIPGTGPKRQKPSVSVEALVYVMPSYIMKEFSGISTETSEFRRSNESPVWFINYGAECRLTTGQFYMQSGLTLTQAGEKNNYNSKFFKGTDTTGSHYNVYTYSYPDPLDSNNTIIAFDSVWVHKSDSVYKEVDLKNMNQIRYIDIPLSLGYQFHSGNHSFGLSGGISLSLLQQSYISLVDEETFAITTYSNADNKLRSKLWSWHGALNYAYSLSGNTSLFVQGAYRRQLQSIYVNHPYGQKYYFYDIKTGIIFKF